MLIAAQLAWTTVDDARTYCSCPSNTRALKGLPYDISAIEMMRHRTWPELEHASLTIGRKTLHPDIIRPSTVTIELKLLSKPSITSKER